MRILVIDNQLILDKALATSLEADGHLVAVAGTALDAVGALGRFDMAVIGLSQVMDSPLDLIPRLLAASTAIKIVVVAAIMDVDMAAKAIRCGAAGYLLKPFTLPQLRLVVSRVEEMLLLGRRVADLQSALGASDTGIYLASANPQMRGAIEMVRRAAFSDSAVLIRGERGTGKGTVARAIHSWSDRTVGPFASVCCPSLSPDLSEGELLAHLKAALAGSTSVPYRTIDQERGTLFLDAVDGLPLPLQPKLLHLVSGSKNKQGAGDSMKGCPNVRLIVAEIIDPPEKASSGRCPWNPFDQPDTLRIDLPPLRARAEDIVPMAERMLLNFSGQRHTSAIRFSSEAQATLRSYPWPGNIEELRNVVERAAILSQEEVVEATRLFLPPERIGSRMPAIGDPISIARVEELHIKAVLSSTDSIEKASQILAMDTVTLWRRRKKYGI